MARKDKKYLEKLKKDNNVSRLWSFSKINTYLNCTYSYFLKYIIHIQETETGIYSILGGKAHDILEEYYNGKITYDDMIINMENELLNIELSELRFDKNDEEKNEKIKEKYFECIRHFFENHQTVKEKILTEKFLDIKIGNHLFQGYIDTIHKEKDTYIITDYKTSTIYTGKKIQKECKQLLLYAYGLMQKGIDIENIKIRWNFLKYNSVTFIQKNGKEKTFNCERHAWVGKIKNQLKRNLKDLDYSDEDIEEMLEECMCTNSIDKLPKEIQDLYTIEDCYVYIDLNKNIIENLYNQFHDIIIEIYTKEKEYEKTKDENIWIKQVEDKDSYFCSNLCGYTKKDCVCYKDYLNNRDLFKNSKPDEQDESDDENWMEELGLI